MFDFLVSFQIFRDSSLSSFWPLTVPLSSTESSLITPPWLATMLCSSEKLPCSSSSDSAAGPPAPGAFSPPTGTLGAALSRSPNPSCPTSSPPFAAATPPPDEASTGPPAAGAVDAPNPRLELAEVGGGGHPLALVAPGLLVADALLPTPSKDSPTNRTATLCSSARRPSLSATCRASHTR